jgi:hypothetical protein
MTDKEPTIEEIKTALEVLSYYENMGKKKDEKMLSALMSDSRSHIRSYAPIVIENREKYHEIMELSN